MSSDVRPDPVPVPRVLLGPILGAAESEARRLIEDEREGTPYHNYGKQVERCLIEVFGLYDGTRVTND